MSTVRQRRHRGVREDRGSVAAETVIAVPVLIAVLVLVGVLIARGVDARLRLDDAAHQAARAASLASTPTAATTAADTTATDALAGMGGACRTPTVAVDVSDFQPGGTVSVTLTCHLDLSSATLLAIPTSRVLTASATSPVDTWRATTP
jgi:Flp pilus assembly protein TadG